jgi:hypothetical protein
LTGSVAAASQIMTAPLIVDQSLDEPLQRFVDWSAADPQPVFWLIGAEHHVPGHLIECARTLLPNVPGRYAERACRYYSHIGSSVDELQWRALGFLVDDARALRFRRILTGKDRNPLDLVHESANIYPDAEGLIPSKALDGPHGEFALGEFDVEVSRSLRATNSTYWLTPMIVGRPSCRVRLDPLRFAPRGRLARVFYAMKVYGPPLNWERIVRLERVEAVQWMADEDGRVEPELLTELVWKPRDDEIVLEVEQLPPQGEVDVSGSRYLHAILDRAGCRFTHLDGAIRWYDGDELIARRNSRLDRVGSIGQRTKIFRLDEPILKEDASDILSAFFVWNYDLAAYLNPDGPEARLSRRTPNHLTGD